MTGAEQGATKVELLGVPIGHKAQYNIFMATTICKRPYLSLCQHVALVGVAFCLFNYETACAQALSPAGDAESQFKHTVKVSRQGRMLILRYVLLDPAGKEQDLREIAQEPPRFTVYQGEKKLATGQFEFG